MDRKIIFNHDLVGIGIGPSNLSLAALLQPTQLNYTFFDKKSEFCWHPGMLMPYSQLQVHYLKDCVSLVDPTNPYSFLNFLVKHRRLYQFLNKRDGFVTRKEYNQYFHWVASSLPYLNFKEKIESINIDKQCFIVRNKHRYIYTKNVVLGIGQKKFIPKPFDIFCSADVFHNGDYLKFSTNNFGGKTIAIIGGGQSGAEMIEQMLNRKDMPKRIIWASKRLNFQPLDDSCFANELYTPTYSQRFYNYPSDLKTALLNEQILTSDGISQELANTIYKKAYEIKFVENVDLQIDMLIYHLLVDLKKRKNNQYLITLQDRHAGKFHGYIVDKIIFATGYQPRLPEYLSTIAAYLNFDKQGYVKISQEYAIVGEFPQDCRIYVQNAARHTHGIADPNLSLMAWRSSVIINSILGKTFYDPTPDNMVMAGQPHLIDDQLIRQTVSNDRIKEISCQTQ